MKNSYRILSIEASDIYDHEQRNGISVGYKLPEKKIYGYFKLFKNVMDPSLDSIELEKVFYSKFRRRMGFFDENKYRYTLAVVNVKFNRVYSAADGKQAVTKQLREHFYKNGFNIIEL